MMSLAPSYLKNFGMPPRIQLCLLSHQKQPVRAWIDQGVLMRKRKNKSQLVCPKERSFIHTCLETHCHGSCCEGCKFCYIYETKVAYCVQIQVISHISVTLHVYPPELSPLSFATLGHAHSFDRPSASSWRSCFILSVSFRTLSCAFSTSRWSFSSTYLSYPM